MAGTVLDLDSIITPDLLAAEIASNWVTWNSYRSKWIEEKKELRNYLYATSTKTTSNAILPWSNTTTTPKLTQISDNLHANYMATLFPQNKWMKWEALDKESGTKLKRDIIQAYMDNKVRQSNFINVASKLVQDYIIFGNCFATVEFEKSFRKKADGTQVLNYVGPKLVRISPYDIVFNPTSAGFEHTPKIIKSVMTLGEVAKYIEDSGNTAYQAIFDRMIANRNAVKGGDGDVSKGNAYTADGFTDIRNYYNSNYVEILTFYGDIYDYTTGRLMRDRIITVVDRCYVLDNVEQPAWSGKAPIFHAGWRERPDNLYAMGPLDNLVGMQYRIDHLENLKADVFDQIAYPITKIKGEVQDFDYAPGSRIYMGEEGDVAYLVPDSTALNADFQIRALEDKMEEMAGAPRQAMGIRTPGEKTAFEVEQLQNSASRIFEHKSAHFERVFLEPALNAMLELSTRNLDMIDNIEITDPNSGAVVFRQIKKEDISGNGKIVPMGARHFAEKARRLQSLNTAWQVKINDPSVGAHLSGKRFAQILSEELNEPELFGENIAVKEQAETQMSMQDTEADMTEQMMIAAENGL
jgi:Bacteriophage head to tail connecting protein